MHSFDFLRVSVVKRRKALLHVSARIAFGGAAYG